MANPVLLQKQIKDNSEDLHNFVRDLKLWEEEMKRKDRQLSNDKHEEFLPPIRRPKYSESKKTANPSKNTAKDKDESKKKRIASHDYKAWETFDVDKACEEVDGEDKNKSEEENEEDADQEEKYLKEKALYDKELGNRHVKANQWDQAIAAYTRAISAYPKDPIFFANRALCYLKKRQFLSAEADCTESLKLDSTYVKALLRRAAAYEALDNLEDASHDLREVLRLEPHHPTAQRDLTKIQSQVGKKKKVQDNALITTDNVKKNDSVTVKKDVVGPTPPSSRITTNQSIAKSGSKVEVVETENEPDWEPCLNIVDPVVKPPHLRSKKHLKRIEIHDIGRNVARHTCARKIPTNQTPSTIAQPPSVTQSTSSVSTQPSPPKSGLVVSSPPSSMCVPPPAKTAVQFHAAWATVKSNVTLCHKFLKQVPGEELPNIFKESLESEMFSNIVQTLASQFIDAGDPVAGYLRGLAGVRRFSTITLFMSPTDKSNVLKLFEYCKNKGECSDEDIRELGILYEV